MRWHRLGFVLGVLLALSSVSLAQIVEDMTPEFIRNAIAIGIKEKDVSWYRIKEKASFSWPPLVAFYTTPFLRVVLAANEAKKHYKTFTEADVARW